LSVPPVLAGPPVEPVWMIGVALSLPEVTRMSNRPWLTLNWTASAAI
jgi:hypothetical protein